MNARRKKPGTDASTFILHVRNLPENCSEDDLCWFFQERHFLQFMLTVEITGKMALVEFSDAESLLRAQEAVDGAYFRGHALMASLPLSGPSDDSWSPSPDDIHQLEEDAQGIGFTSMEDSFDDVFNSPPRKKATTEDDLCKVMWSMSPFKAKVTPGARNEGTNVRKGLFDVNRNKAGEEMGFEDVASGFTEDLIEEENFNFFGQLKEVAPPSLNTEAEDFHLDEDFVPLPGTSARQPVVEGVIPLGSDEGIRRVLVALVNLREAFLPKRKHQEAYQRLQADLEERRVYATIPELTKKRRYFLDQYSKKKNAGSTTWPYYAPCSVICGDREVSTLVGTKYETYKVTGEPPNPTVTDYKDVIFPKVAQWSIKSTFALIEAYGLVKGEFDKPRRHSSLWTGISKDLFQKNSMFRFSPVQCEAKWRDLEKKHKDCVDELEGSGASRADAELVSWPFFQEMEKVKMGDVGVRPTITLAVGSSCETVNHKSPVGGTSSGTVADKRVGKSRPPSTKKKSAVDNEAAEALKRIAKAMEKRNRLLAKSVENKNGN